MLIIHQPNIYTWLMIYQDITYTTLYQRMRQSEVVHGITKYIHISDSDKNNFKREIENDLVLSMVNNFTILGGQKVHVATDLRLFFNDRDTNLVTDDLVFFEHRIVVPENIYLRFYVRVTWVSQKKKMSV